MPAETMTCGGCGAALSVKGGPKFVDCRFCGVSLRIHRTDSAIATEVLERVDTLDRDVGELRGASALLALDNEWSKRREWYRSRSRFEPGDYRRPSNLAFWGFVIPAVGLFFALWNITGAGVFTSPAMLIIAMMVGSGVFIRQWHHRLADAFDREHREYLASRAAIESRAAVASEAATEERSAP